MLLGDGFWCDALKEMETRAEPAHKNFADLVFAPISHLFSA
jgi:hypothetical protein